MSRALSYHGATTIDCYRVSRMNQLFCRFEIDRGEPSC
jgi:hypothetical protein